MRGVFAILCFGVAFKCSQYGFSSLCGHGYHVHAAPGVIVGLAPPFHGWFLLAGPYLPFFWWFFFHGFVVFCLLRQCRSLRRRSFLLMRFQPVGAPAAVGNEGYLHLECLLHLFHYYTFHLLALLGIDREVEFVVYLKYHL